MAEAGEVLEPALRDEVPGTAPIELFTLAQIQQELGKATAEDTRDCASKASVDYCFPSRLEEMCVLQRVIAAHPDDASPHYLLGNFLYDRRRHEEAIQEWEIAARLDPSFATVWRNLGVALFNIRGLRDEAVAAFDRAFAANPADARVLYERDQLWKRTGESPERRMNELQKHGRLVGQRDDLSVELATLLNQTGKPAQALELLLKRHFQPWEGGEGLVLGQYTRALLMLGQAALEAGRAGEAIESFKAADQPPENLSEAKHLLANNSDIAYWRGVAYHESGNAAEATRWWQYATQQREDFQQMSVRRISEMSYWSALALLRLGKKDQADALLHEIYDYSLEVEATTPKIDYFATSLPSILLFEENLAHRKQVEAFFLRSQALMGLNRVDEAVILLHEVLKQDSNHTGAADLLRQVQEATARS